MCAAAVSMSILPSSNIFYNANIFYDHIDFLLQEFHLSGIFVNLFQLATLGSIISAGKAIK